MDIETNSNKGKLYSLRKKIHFIRKTVDMNYSGIEELNKKINDLYNCAPCGDNTEKSCDSSRHRCASYCDIEIDNLSFCEKIPMSVSNTVREFIGTFKICDFKISNIAGYINILDFEIDLSNYVTLGYLKIVNTSNNVIYDGIIYSDTQIRYIISNRPVIPIGISINAILLINFKIVKID